VSAQGADHHLPLRGGARPGDELGLCRISLDSVDALSFRSGDGAGTADDKGSFARPLLSPWPTSPGRIQG
jgi:hypothetical protein